MNYFKKCAGDYTGTPASFVSEQMQVYVETKDCNIKISREDLLYMRRFEEDGFYFPTGSDKLLKSERQILIW